MPSLSKGFPESNLLSKTETRFGFLSNDCFKATDIYRYFLQAHAGGHSAQRAGDGALT